MRAGLLRHRLTFQTQSSTTDETGQKTDSWSTTFTVWGEVEDLSASELLASGGYSAQVSTRVTVRPRSGITAGMRIIHGVRTFEITGPPVDLTGRNRELEIPTKEITP